MINRENRGYSDYDSNRVNNRVNRGEAKIRVDHNRSSVFAGSTTLKVAQPQNEAR